jgi:2-oxoglutarate ferredoxin oxidoreductase subunit beta
MAKKKKETAKEQHPLEHILRMDTGGFQRCSGCGIGIVVNSLAQAVEGSDMDRSRFCVVSSGIGCTGHVADELNFDANITVHTDVFDEAIRISRRDPRKKVVLVLTDADLQASSADGIVKAGKMNANILLIYINNYLYRLFIECKQNSSFRFLIRKADSEMTPFNIPHLAKTSGAEYVARWTPLHVRRLGLSIRDGLKSKGFGVIEVTSPCLMYHQNMVDQSPLDRMGQFFENSVILHNEPTENLDLRGEQGIIVGKFVGRDMDE